jgi:6-phosphogluconate dehydrogenase
MSNIILTALLLFLSSLASGLILLSIVNRFLKQQKQAAIEAVRLYFEPQSPDEQSQFAAFIEIAAGILSSKMIASLKATFMGMQSVDKRNEQRLQTDMFSDMIGAANPLIGSVLDMFPAVKKRLMKNPELAELAISKIAEMAAKRGGNGAEQVSVSGNGNHSQNSDKFLL